MRGEPWKKVVAAGPQSSLVSAVFWPALSLNEMS